MERARVSSEGGEGEERDGGSGRLVGVESGRCGSERERGDFLSAAQRHKPSKHSPLLLCSALCSTLPPPDIPETILFRFYILRSSSFFKRKKRAERRERERAEEEGKAPSPTLFLSPLSSLFYFFPPPPFPAAAAAADPRTRSRFRRPSMCALRMVPYDSTKRG
jgi:hypothetical protein